MSSPREVQAARDELARIPSVRVEAMNGKSFLFADIDGNWWEATC
jgi:hypothetical protein